MRAESTVRLAVAASAVCLLLGSAACGGVPCRNLSQAQSHIAERTRAPSDGKPHLQLLVPHHRLNLLIAEALRQGGAPSYELPNPARLLPLPRLTVAVESVRVAESARGKLAFEAELAAKAGAERLVAMTLEIEATPVVTRHGAAMAVELRFDADAVRSVKPVLGDRASKGLAEALSRAVPPAVLSRVPKALRAALVSQMLSYFVGEGFRLVRENLLAGLGELTRVRIELPQGPIARVVPRTVRGPQASLVLDIYTDLAVEKGLAPLPASSPVFGEARVRVSGSALAALANWGIKTGTLPQRYDQQLRPSPVGNYLPVYHWRGGKRPLLVYVFRGSSPCSIIHVGARAKAKVLRGKVVAIVTDGDIERVEGSAAIRFGVWVKQLFSGALGRTEEFVSTTTVTIRDQTVAGELVEASLDESELLLTLELSLVRKTARR